MFGKKKEEKELVKVQEYKRIVNYYETDKMGITHHSNYIRFMEEARVDYLEKIGWSYSKLEEIGAISPVVNVDVNYKKPTTFNDEITIRTCISEYSGIKFIFKYEMTNAKGEIVCTAKSVHVFVTKENKLVMVNHWNPELDQVIKNLVVAEENK